MSPFSLQLQAPFMRGSYLPLQVGNGVAAGVVMQIAKTRRDNTFHLLSLSHGESPVGCPPFE